MIGADTGEMRLNTRGRDVPEPSRSVQQSVERHHALLQTSHATADAKLTRRSQKEVCVPTSYPTHTNMRPHTTWFWKRRGLSLADVMRV